MIEILFSILAAVITMIFAGLLVKYQEKNKEKTEELSNEFDNNLGEAVNEFEALTGEKITDHSLEKLENDMKQLNDRIYSVRYSPSPHSRRLERGKRHVKNKKNPPND